MDRPTGCETDDEDIVSPTTPSVNKIPKAIKKKASKLPKGSPLPAKASVRPPPQLVRGKNTLDELETMVKEQMANLQPTAA